MKKLKVGILLGAMVLSLGAVTASAATTEATEDSEVTRKAPFNIEEKASEAGLSVEEYLAQMEVEFDGKNAKTERAKTPFANGERPEGAPEFDGERPEGAVNFEEKQAEMEEKATELGLTVEEYKEQIKAEKEAEREALLLEKATEAGLTVEEFIEQNTPNFGGKKAEFDGEIPEFDGEKPEGMNMPKRGEKNAENSAVSE